MTINEFVKLLDFNENNYFYHVTGIENADLILKEGLYIDGNNILNANSILETTTLPLTEDMISENLQFQKFLEGEFCNSGIRDTSALIVLGAPKSEKKDFILEFDHYKDDRYYSGLVLNQYVMGYFCKDTLEFVVNDNFNYGTDAYYDSINYR